jgi:hypothetical protein
MKIHDDHFYHGATLTQIAEHPQFTAINAFKSKAIISRSAFIINDNIGVFHKYATNPAGRYKEYVFTFKLEHLEELERLQKKAEKVFLALVCVKDREICCLPYESLLNLIAMRRNRAGFNEEQYAILATIPKRKAFRVYVNSPGKKNTMLAQIIIPRKDFPEKLFNN